MNFPSPTDLALAYFALRSADRVAEFSDSLRPRTNSTIATSQPFPGCAAAVVIVSDGLERGDPAALCDAVAKLSRRAWRVSWLTPLATAGACRRAREQRTEPYSAVRNIGDRRRFEE